MGAEVGKGLVGLSTEQIKDLTRYANGDRLAELSKPAYQALSATGDPSAFDPRLDTRAATIYNINANTPADNAAVVNATIVMNTLKGNSGCGVITIGGCDYHQSNAAASDAVDATIGTEIGRAVELAFQLKKPLFIHILTDGGVGAPTGSRD